MLNHFTDKHRYSDYSINVIEYPMYVLSHRNWMMGEKGELEKMLGPQLFSFNLIGGQDNLYQLKIKKYKMNSITIESSIFIKISVDNLSNHLSETNVLIKIYF